MLLSHTLSQHQRGKQRSQGQEMHHRGLGKIKGDSVFQPSTAGKHPLGERSHTVAEVVVINVEWVLPGIGAHGWLTCAPWWP